MAKIEERLSALEQEKAALKRAVELQMIALRALATKDAFEELRDINNKIFDVLISHDRVTNERLGDQQTQIIELDGKIVGLQVETRQGFTEMRQRFDLQDARSEAQEQNVSSRFERQDRKIDQILLLLNTLTVKPHQEMKLLLTKNTRHGLAM